jgi:hypothetical protein
MKGSAVIDELLSQDYQTFPRDDPAELARQAKRMVEEDKMRKEQEKERKEAEKREAAAVKKAVAMPVKGKEAPPAAKSGAVPAIALKRMKVQLYFKHLGHKLSLKEPKNLLTMGEEDVDTLLSSIQAELQSAGGIDMASNFFVGGVAAFEQITNQWNPLGLALSGPAASLTGSVAANKDKWEELVKEFAIEYAEYFLMGPGKRLIGFTVQMVNTVDTANKVAIVEMLNSRRQVSEDTKAAAKDL